MKIKELKFRKISNTILKAMITTEDNMTYSRNYSSISELELYKVIKNTENIREILNYILPDTASIEDIFTKFEELTKLRPLDILTISDVYELALDILDNLNNEVKYFESLVSAIGDLLSKVKADLLKYGDMILNTTYVGTAYDYIENKVIEIICPANAKDKNDFTILVKGIQTPF